MTQPHTSANGQAQTIKKLFSRQTTVAIDIAAPATKIWTLLTDASRFVTWNSTIVELTGTIAPGGKIQLRSKLAPGRKFKLRVKDIDPCTFRRSSSISD